MTKNLHVVQNNKMWEVKTEGSSQPISHHHTQENAIGTCCSKQQNVGGKNRRELSTNISPSHPRKRYWARNKYCERKAR